MVSEDSVDELKTEGTDVPEAASSKEAMATEALDIEERVIEVWHLHFPVLLSILAFRNPLSSSKTLRLASYFWFWAPATVTMFYGSHRLIVCAQS